mmetsp:Transcript_26688/g.67807  ORF Transcript_26688/g.67807 Transcript_26688/m.67807 type:complete len:282 (-) Transcript_26688:377-1222(-)
MLPSAPAALQRTAGCWLRSILTTASTDSLPEPPSVCPICPTAAMAAAATRVSLSLKSPRTAASWPAPALPMAPSAAAATALTSGLLSASSFATSSANFQPSAPTLPNASAAAQRGIRIVALTFPPMHAAESAATCLSSKSSPSSLAMVGAEEEACSPAAPRAVAAAHLAHPSFALKRFAAKGTRLLASDILEKTVVAASRTSTSSSCRQPQIALQCASASSPMAPRHFSAAAFASGSWLVRTFATPAAAPDASLPRHSIAPHAAHVTAGDGSLKHCAMVST